MALVCLFARSWKAVVMASPSVATCNKGWQECAAVSILIYRVMACCQGKSFCCYLQLQNVPDTFWSMQQ